MEDRPCKQPGLSNGYPESSDRESGIADRTERRVLPRKQVCGYYCLSGTGDLACETGEADSGRSRSLTLDNLPARSWFDRWVWESNGCIATATGYRGPSMQERPTVGTRNIKVFRTAGSNGLPIGERQTVGTRDIKVFRTADSNGLPIPYARRPSRSIS